MRKPLNLISCAQLSPAGILVTSLHSSGSIHCGGGVRSEITVYLLNGGLLEYTQQMAAHESARTTKLYDRRNDQVTLDEVERIAI